jgi:anti-sigma regulatory factor (Ser/Thr protein kinase)
MWPLSLGRNVTGVAAFVGGGGPHRENSYTVSQSDLAVLREHVARHGQASGLPTDRVNDLILVANELASNVVRHGGGTGRMRLWADSRAVWCEVSDSGSGIADPDHVGLRRSPLDAVTGRGLWMIRRLADEVVILTGEQGTTVTVTMVLPA